jgi:TolA-binding protein
MRLAMMVVGVSLLVLPLLALAESATTQLSSDGVNASAQQREILKAKARARARQDSGKYSADKIKEAEQLYQVANDRKNWRTQTAIDSLKKMIEKYPNLNRTGCAILYLGQMSEGDEQEKYWKEAIEKHGDSFYLNGVQVGALGRFYLGGYYRDHGDAEKSKQFWDEVLKDYPGSIAHDGKLLSALIAAERAATTQPAK